MLNGSCLCGSVAYEVDAPLGPIVHCHCESCRKAHGSAFSSLAAVPLATFRWSRGEDVLSRYESSPGKTRYFCSRCGSPIAAAREGQPNIMLRLGCLDTKVTDRPAAHIWRSDCASWYDPKDLLPEFPRLPEGG